MAVIDDVVRIARSQVGKAYVFNAHADITNPNPAAFDCSEFTEWVFARARAGVRLAEASYQQYWQCRNARRLITADQAMNTPGALLFRFLDANGKGVEPTPRGDRAVRRHVAISLGGRRVVEAANPQVGVREAWYKTNTFTIGGLVPQLNYPVWGAGPVGGNPPPPPPPPPPPTSIRDRFRPRPDLPILRQGSQQGNQIRQAQRMLIRLGAPSLQPWAPNGTATYGPATREAVLWFQRKVRAEQDSTMRVTGEIGPLTWGWLFAYLG